MQLARALSLALIVALSSTIFSGCKQDEAFRNARYAGSVTLGAVAIIDLAFGGALDEFMKWIMKWIDSTEPPVITNPPPPEPGANVEYKNFVDRTYGFSFDYPVKIDGVDFNGEPKSLKSNLDNTPLIQELNLTGSLAATNVIPTTVVINGNVVRENGGNIYNFNNSTISSNSISGSRGTYSRSATGETIPIEESNNKVTINGENNIFEIFGSSNEIHGNNSKFEIFGSSNKIHSNNSEFEIFGSGNRIYGSGNKVMMNKGVGNEFVDETAPPSPPTNPSTSSPTSSPTNPPTSPPTSPQPPKFKKSQPKPDTIAYGVELRNSKIYVGTNFCNGRAGLKKYLESKYKNVETSDINTRTFNFKFADSQNREILAVFENAGNVDKFQRYYYVYWIHKKVTATDENIAKRIFDRFKVF